jgi:hypothetical protein
MLKQSPKPGCRLTALMFLAVLVGLAGLLTGLVIQ